GLLGLGRIRARAALERAEFGFDFGGGHARGARWREGRVHFTLGEHGVFRGFDLVLHAPEFVERAGAAAHFAEALRSAAGLGLLSARGDRAFAELEFFDFALHVLERIFHLERGRALFTALGLGAITLANGAPLLQEGFARERVVVVAHGEFRARAPLFDLVIQLFDLLLELLLGGDASDHF